MAIHSVGDYVQYHTEISESLVGWRVLPGASMHIGIFMPPQAGGRASLYLGWGCPEDGELFMRVPGTDTRSCLGGCTPLAPRLPGIVEFSAKTVTEEACASFLEEGVCAHGVDPLTSALVTAGSGPKLRQALLVMVADRRAGQTVDEAARSTARRLQPYFESTAQAIRVELEKARV